MNSLLRRILLTCMLGLAPTLTLAETLVISQAWIREGPPSAQVLAAYMRIDNSGSEDRIITAASSPGFDKVEMHRTEVVDGMARMQPQDRIEVPAGASLTLEPGGLHLMLLGPASPLTAGQNVSVRLQLADGGTVPVELEVRRAEDPAAAGDHTDHSHHHHHHH